MYMNIAGTRNPDHSVYINIYIHMLAYNTILMPLFLIIVFFICVPIIRPFEQTLSFAYCFVSKHNV